MHDDLLTPSQEQCLPPKPGRFLSFIRQKLLARAWLPPLLPFRYQLLGHLIAGVMMALILTAVLGDQPATIEQKSRPFTTHSKMLAVTVAFYPDAPPQILAVQPLDEGRVSITQPGDYTLSLQDGRGEDLYHLSFPVTFTIPGVGRIEENRLIFVVPYSKEVQLIVVAGPQGLDSYFLSE